MVIIDGNHVKVDTRSLINFSRRRRGRWQNDKYVPDDIWFEILSRLPIKSLLISRSVCKLWRNFSFTLGNKIDNNLYVPLCGLVLLSFHPLGVSNDVDYFFSYFCLKTNKFFITEFDESPENDLIYSSGFERGLLSDLSFDFRFIENFIPIARDEYASFVMHGGLVLVNFDDGTSRVHNPATKEISVVPKCPTMEKYGLEKHNAVESPGFIIQFPSRLTGQRCRFIVVRFSSQLQIMEIYYSVTRMWKTYHLKLDAGFLDPVSCFLQNYVGFFEGGVLCLYMLTGQNSVFVTKFKCLSNPETKQYLVPLPKGINEEESKARIWECEKSLYLSHYTATSLRIWKPCSTQVDAWSWVIMLEITPSRQTCKPVARKHLSKPVLNNDDRVMPFACNPNVAIVYLLVNSLVFAYNLNEDSLEKIGEIKDQGQRSFDEVHTFTPCLSYMDAHTDGC